MSRYLFSTLLLASCFAFALTGKDNDVLDAEFDRLVSQLCNVLHVPGISLAVIHKDSFESKGYGHAVLPDVEATSDTLWFTGSTTKAFTAAAAALIVHDSVDFPDVSWSSPLSSLLPFDFALEDDYCTSHITLEDALSHRSGLPRHDLAYGWSEGKAPHAVDIIHTMRHLPLTAEPRTEWQYCNLMYGSVGQALTGLGGIGFGDVLRKLIWEPLGMRSTTTSTIEAAAARDAQGQKRLSRGYYWDKDHYLPEPYADLNPLAGAGATISSVNDYALWIQALLNAGANDSSPISAAIYKDVTRPRTIMRLDPRALDESFPPLYALGWINIMLGSHRVITHSGSVTGFGANVYILPDEGFGFVSMANTMGSSNQLGALLFIAATKKLGLMSSNNHTAHLDSLHDGLASYSKARQQSSLETDSNHILTGAELPLPGRVADYIGSYHHPAYGVFNVSAVDDQPNYYQSNSASTQESMSSTSAVSLRIRPSQRTWPFEIGLKHKANTLFATQIYWVHGQGDVGNECVKETTARTETSEIKCRQEVVLEPLIEARAVFEHDLDGKVAKLGVELEPEMLQKDESKWRDGMIWFEKQA